MAESEVKCFSGVQTAQNSKTEGGIKRTKHENVKLKKEYVPGAILSSEKNRRMHRETASEMASLPLSQNNRKEHAAG